MATLTVTRFVSDVSGNEIDPEQAVRITVQYPDDPDHVRQIDCSIEEAGAFADKGTVVAKRGRKKDAKPGEAKPEGEGETPAEDEGETAAEDDTPAGKRR